jgi:GNAT superfamily N-acetyltransferase
VRRRKPRYQQRKGFGSILLADALDHASEAAKTAGSVMAAADALNATGATFYTAHGFVRLPHSPDSFFQRAGPECRPEAELPSKMRISPGPDLQC